MANKTVIIGGVAGGATTAARLRRLNETAEIILLEKGEYISFANCGLPYYVGDVISERDNLLLQTPEAMYKKFNIDVRVLNEVMSINSEEKKVVVKNLKTGKTYDESYDQLVISTGSSPIKPQISGINSDKIFTIWTVPDTDRIKEVITKHNTKSAVVIGGGFIGLEMAENLHHAGIKVTLVEKMNQVMATIDYDMATLIHENLQDNQVPLYLEDGVLAFHEDKEHGTVTVELESGKELETDIVILAIGVKPNSELAKQAGLTLNQRGGIVVDEHLQTSIEDIYAVGDVIEVTNPIFDKKTMIPLAGPANKQGRIVADIIATKINSNNINSNLNTNVSKTYNGTLGASIAKVFDYDVASVGLNEKQLHSYGKRKNVDYYTALINQKSHAGYYPEATPITLKMHFDTSGKILGCQIVGREGVDKRIDTIATTIRLGGTVYDLEELEFAYAPPFTSAKDPVNMLGFVAENILKGLVTLTEVSELDALEEKTVILDVTEDVERMVYEIPDSYHIPLGQLRQRMNELNKELPIVVYCAIGVRAYNAARILMQHGFKNVSVLAGGLTFYKSMHYADYLPDEELQVAEYKTNQIDFDKEDLSQKDEETVTSQINQIKILDCCGLQCPGPIMKVNEAITSMNENELLEVSATDMGFTKDIQSWCRQTGNTYIKTERRNKENIVTIKKGSSCETKPSTNNDKEGKTLIVFSGDFDKVLASFIIANGAASMGRPVTMFFTFWGLNALRKSDKKNVKKPFIDAMFGKMMPKGTKKLKLSKMNMAGMGTAMMKKVMKDKNVNSLEDLMKQAMNQGIKLVACTMSMDVMGITKEEIIDGVEFAGVATYLGDAEESNVNLFI
jgi:NADPH-dependent 2,4-dienoyl-CoA reductase/sulfur reductase-like enzyme/peroxiredoxin family protein/TusA-related sulfurtransferase/rhodanese-related sulfurtransferase